MTAVLDVHDAVGVRQRARWSCVTTTTARPLVVASPRSRSITRAPDAASSAAVGSSARMIGGIADERARDRDALLLAAARGPPGSAAASREPHRVPARRARASARLAAALAPDVDRERDVLQRRQRREQVEALEDEADVPQADPGRSRSGRPTISSPSTRTLPAVAVQDARP